MVKDKILETGRNYCSLCHGMEVIMETAMREIVEFTKGGVGTKLTFFDCVSVLSHICNVYSRGHDIAEEFVDYIYISPILSHVTIETYIPEKIKMKMVDKIYELKRCLEKDPYVQ